jgi:hypothetical protein
VEKRMIGGWKLGILVALDVAIGCRGIAQEAASDTGALGSIAIQSSPCPALVYVGGHFAGLTSERGPLVVTLRPERVQVRLTQSGYPDTVFPWMIESGSCHHLRITLGKTPIPPGPVRIRVGQAC